MKKIVAIAKDIIKTAFGVISLLTMVYIGAITFIGAVILDKLFAAFNSSWTVDKLINTVEAYYTEYYNSYKHHIENFQLKGIKFPF